MLRTATLVCLLMTLSLAYIPGKPPGEPQALKAPIPCSVIRYLSEDEPCISNSTTYTCKFGQVCIKNDKGEFHCHSRRDGATCPGGSDAECSPAYVCFNKYCRVRRWAGEQCLGNKQCISYNCTNGVCRGKQMGESCTFETVDGGVTYTTESQCDTGLYCNYTTGRCEDDLQENQPCGWENFPSAKFSALGTAAQASCGDGLFCDYKVVINATAQIGSNLGYCRQFYQGPEGAPCNQYTRCRVGFDCTNGVCTASSPWDTCNPGLGHSDCSAGTFCVCNPDLNDHVYRCFSESTQQRYIDCEPSEQAFYDCLESKPCHYPFTYDYVEGSCGYAECLDEYVAYRKCRGCNTRPDVIDRGTPPCPSSALPMVVSGGWSWIMGILIVLMMVGL